MDHQAIAQLLGNYGEFIGAIAVVVTLGFLVIEVRSSNRLLMSQHREMNRATLLEINHQKIVDRDFAELMHRSRQPDHQLDEVDAWRVRMQVSNEVIGTQNLYLRAKLVKDPRMMSAALDVAARGYRASVFFREAFDGGRWDDAFRRALLEEIGD
jgi:hypothetical protein